ncbi:MAG: alpha/beta hydrolase [Gemmatimonadota bacterium]|nr:alpha/beta hydrolase [Gemmatimonadota bacterium]
MIQYSELTAAVVSPADHRLAYGQDVLQFGELRLPAGTAPAPLVVFIHGGCWRSQYDLKHVAQAAEALAKDGFATWTIEYRRVGDPGGGWPGTFDDISRAVDHVRALAIQFPRIDTTRVVLMGHSAGGQLALWAASRKQNETTGLFRSSRPPLPIVGVIGLAAITDLAEYGAAPGGCNGAVTPLMGGTAAAYPDRYRAVSPVERSPIGVRVALVHGDADPIVPVAQSKKLIAKERAEGASPELTTVPGAGHFDLVAPQSEAWAAVLRALHSLVDRRMTPGMSATIPR